MFELKVMEPAAFKFDYIATQAGQSSAGMPEKTKYTRIPFFLRTEILCPWLKNCKEAVGRS